MTDNRRACRIALYHDGSITDPPEELEQLKRWVIDKTPPFVDTFQPYLKELASD